MTDLSTLKSDVRFLTTLLGDVMSEQEGPAFLKKVEEIRGWAKELRSHPDPASWRREKNLISSLSPEQAFKVARAFTIYFQLVNLAEERQRVRRIREYGKPGAPAQEMSLKRSFVDLKARHVTARTVEQLLHCLEIEPVLTAHPTEVKRRTVLDHLIRIAGLLSERGRADRTEAEVLSAERQIKAELEILWQTNETRQRRVSVADEVEQTLFYFKRTILELVPDMIERVRGDFRSVFQADLRLERPFIRFGSWVGSDRDGNPNVTEAVTVDTVRRHRALVLGHYLSAVEALMLRMSQSTVLVGEDAQLSRSVEKDRADFPALARELERYESTELYRKKFTFIYERLSRAARSAKGGYREPAEFIADLEVIRESLIRHRAPLAAEEGMGRLIWQVRTFGFHLAGLDVRDHAQKLQTAPNEIMAQLKLMRRLQDRYGRPTCETYILSMTDSAEQILQLFAMARRAGLIRRGVKGHAGRASVMLVPLFENIDALERSGDILEKLFSDKHYRRYLTARKNVQEVMLGYSDSSKDGGYLSANFCLYRAQKKIAEVAARHHVALKVFHGKGGSIDRGGGLSHRAVVSQPFAAPHAMMKITEQGEVVNQKYANHVIAQRNLEQLASSVVWTYLVSQKEAAQEKRLGRWESVLSELSERAQAEYRRLVFDTPGFMDFYRHATPIELLGVSRIASRPASRNRDGAFTSLRAIPWVFSWIQSRYIISAWYGMGSAFASHIQEGGAAAQAQLKEMYREWPFFRQLVDNAQVSLAKTDLFIAEQYSHLAPDAAVAREIHSRIAAEHARAVSAVLSVTGAKQLLDFNPVLRESIRLRNPYVDPLNYIQLKYLEASRKPVSGDEAQVWTQAILLLTLNGIAFGMKSTG